MKPWGHVSKINNGLKNRVSGVSNALMLDAFKKLQWQTSEELEALLPSILDRAFKGEL
jgi:hypothetical protein